MRDVDTRNDQSPKVIRPVQWTTSTADDAKYSLHQGCARDLPARDRDVQSRDRDRDQDADNSFETRPRPRPPIDRDETEIFEEGLETFTWTCRRSSMVIQSKYQVKY